MIVSQESGFRGSLIAQQPKPFCVYKQKFSLRIVPIRGVCGARCQCVLSASFIWCDMTEPVHDHRTSFPSTFTPFLVFLPSSPPAAPATSVRPRTPFQTQSSMATVGRNPLASRTIPPQSPSGHQGLKTTRTACGISKRSRSPDPVHDSRGKRPKGVPLSPAPSHTQPAGPARDDGRTQDKEEKRALREAQREEFRIKYRKAFPSWVFHFDADLIANPVSEELQADIEYLGAVRPKRPSVRLSN